MNINGIIVTNFIDAVVQVSSGTVSIGKHHYMTCPQRIPRSDPMLQYAVEENAKDLAERDVSVIWAISDSEDDRVFLKEHIAPVIKDAFDQPHPTVCHDAARFLYKSIADLSEIEETPFYPSQSPEALFDCNYSAPFI